MSAGGTAVSEAAAWKDRAEVFSRSYVEMQIFLRNKDEEIRSLLMTLSFLTVAGVTLFIFSRGQLAAADVVFRGRPWNAANAFFGCFIVSLFFGVASALVALDPHSHRANFLSLPRRPWLPPDAHRTSFTMLYHSSVAGDLLWGSRIEQSPASLWEGLARSLHRDARWLARRVEHKLERFADAQAFASFALITLILLAFARLPHASSGTRVDAIRAFLCYGGFMPAGTYLRMQWSRFPGVEHVLSKRRVRWRVWRRLNKGVAGRAFLFYGVPPLVGIVLLFVLPDEWAAIWYLLVWNLVSRLLQRQRKLVLRLTAGALLATLGVYYGVGALGAFPATGKKRENADCSSFVVSLNAVVTASDSNRFGTVAARSLSQGKEELARLKEFQSGSTDPTVVAMLAEETLGVDLLERLARAIATDEADDVRGYVGNIEHVSRRLGQLAAQANLTKCSQAALGGS